jgi:hypothetical protein
MTPGSAADAELPRTEAIVRLVKYRNGERTGVGALRADGTVVATPWSRLEELFAEPDPRRAVAGLDLTQAAAVQVEQFLAPALVNLPEEVLVRPA